MRLHVLVEGASEAAFLKGWFPRLLPRHALRVIVHEGKGRLPRKPKDQPDPMRRGLLDQLPAKLRAYGRTLNAETDRVVVLIDADDEDCRALKRRLLKLLQQCDPKPTVVFRIAVEETEAFYLGDQAAIRQAFPRAKPHEMRTYVQDSVCGTWERFREVIGAEIEDKVGWAEQIAPYLSTQPGGRGANKSPSFHHLRRALLRLAGEPAA